jgi:transposase
MKLAIRYKGNGRYAYETRNKWNKEKKKYETVWTYLGIVSPETGEYQKKRDSKKKEQLILNYGDSYVLNDFAVKSGLFSMVEGVFGKLTQSIFALCFFKLLESAAMQHAQTWIEGNYARILFPYADLQTQRISDMLKEIGDEQLQREFFKHYLEKVYSKNGVIIDSTGLPNDISFPLTALGYHGGNIENETRLLMVVDKENSQPLYFRYMAGNIVDVSTLETTIKEIKTMGVDANYALLDAGYYSETNIKHLFKSEISFLIRLPAGRTLFADLIEQTHQTIETPTNRVIYGDRCLFIQKVTVTLYDEYPAFAYVCCDINRKADETVRLLIESKENGLSDDVITKKLKRAGMFVLLCASDIPTTEILPLYYLRQSAEQIFQISKSYADILPLRVHSEAAFRGVLFLNFLSVVLYLNLREQLPQNVTVEAAVKQMRNLMCKIYDGGSTVPLEPNKKQRLILEAIEDTVGKF